jgi:hypothetical protein
MFIIIIIIIIMKSSVDREAIIAFSILRKAGFAITLYYHLEDLEKRLAS